ncbi:MAG TPA: SpoIIE family protein phosphatase [Terracidiphilus sp.]|nr:SpoIIE family protein phosphatase [Terracidiphilus sp.]
MKVFIILVVFFFSSLPIPGQVIDFDRDRLPVAQLDGPWRFQPGDSPAWAARDFDDSKWSLLDAKSGWSNQGFKGYSGLAWYRLRVDLPSQHGPLSLLVPYVAANYEVYANGTLIGAVGQMPPNPGVVLTANALYPIPDSLMRVHEPLVLAFRVSRLESMDSHKDGGLLIPPILGEQHSMDRLRELVSHERFWSTTDTLINFVCNMLTALAGLALFALRRKEREYLWFGSAQLMWGALALTYLLINHDSVEYYTAGTLLGLFKAAAQLLNLEFFITLLRQPKRALYWMAFAGSVGPLLLILLLSSGLASVPVFNAGCGILDLVYGVCVPALLYHGAIGGIREARLLIVPFTMSFSINVAGDLESIPVLAGLGWVRLLSPHLRELIHVPFPMSAFNLAGDLAMFSVVAVLVLRYARSRRDEERLASELEAARAVQHVLIPDDIPALPGYHVECVYKPAGQVGGDFFQILPLPQGDALIAIGDVSGKGMPAAMTVSMVVGMVRMLARSTRSPAAILEAMNQSMIGRTSGGFTTCLMLHIAADGWVTAANAGHVAPYIGGRELAIESGLPLALSVTAAYAETGFQLSSEDHLTLLTDGVLEARRADGELFGFERAASMSEKPAAEIARAAEQFGQEDDITVLSVIRQPPEKDSIKLAETGSWFPAPA